ncbi:MAG TPA: hypothetical protein DDZ51_18865 [Planctomycetaceae bacterium]|nr:hypothetical protein [Planctomycetaceae bacterium]
MSYRYRRQKECGRKDLADFIAYADGEQIVWNRLFEDNCDALPLNDVTLSSEKFESVAFNHPASNYPVTVARIRNAIR